MTPTIGNLQLLCLGLGLVALAALGCASSSTGVETTPVSEKTSKTAKRASASSLAPVYFDLDKAVLRAAARKDLKARAQTIQEQPEWGVVTIEGHCDERGSDEYNLALGERRAAAVKRYLMDRGVPAKRLKTVSFGESQPAARGHTETAWGFNRRSAFATETAQSANRANR
jgi:peptidoglycan-associated lipoprotein